MRVGWFIQRHPDVQRVAAPCVLMERGQKYPIGGWMLNVEGTVFTLEVFRLVKQDPEVWYQLSGNEWSCEFSFPEKDGWQFREGLAAYRGGEDVLLEEMLHCYGLVYVDHRYFLVQHIEDASAMERDLIMARFYHPSWVWDTEQPVPYRI
jgi:hypothetical protein